jgi:hypothetical protein
VSGDTESHSEGLAGILCRAGAARRIKGLRRMTQGQEEGRENPIQPIRASVFHSSPNLKVLRDQCSEALHILDRFHIMVKMNQAFDDVRAEESRRVPREGHEPVLKKSRWLLLKREQNSLTGRANSPFHAEPAHRRQRQWNIAETGVGDCSGVPAVL